MTQKGGKVVGGGECVKGAAARPPPKMPVAEACGAPPETAETRAEALAAAPGRRLAYTFAYPCLASQALAHRPPNSPNSSP
ncbi:hypothetical protein A0257_05725 [Hymenobacter psoromatis]|nr:hypothetical protein A0257_05725 [Hymenobacter psoromatis]